MGQVLGIDPKTGKELWSCETQHSVVHGPQHRRRGRRFLSGSAAASGAAFAVRLGGRGDVSSSHRVWTGTTNSNVPSPLVHEGHMYWASDNQGIVYCADAATGKTVYQERLPRADQFYASPILADGKIYYLSRSGKTFVVAASPKFKLLATNDLRPATNGACSTPAPSRPTAGS